MSAKQKLRALALNCSLKSSPSVSSTDLMLDQLDAKFRSAGVETERVRVADFNVVPGVTNDEGDGDQWPQILSKVRSADILVFGTPIWMGSSASISKRVVERLDALLSEADEHSRFPTYNKVAMVAVVGNEDGAHHASAELFQWLNDVGYTIPANASVYWVGEAMQGIDYKDLDTTPSKVASAQSAAVSNTVHLARLLQTQQYPGVKSP